MKLNSYQEFLNEQEETLNEGNLSQKDFPKFLEFIENLIPKNKRISFFIEDHRLLIGYFPESASFADLSKSMPEKVKSAIESKFGGKPFTFINSFEKRDNISGKTLVFSAVSAKNSKDLIKIEDLF
jgi:hypothetical protein